jgi:ribose transport system permease protein
MKSQKKIETLKKPVFLGIRKWCLHYLGQIVFLLGLFLVITLADQKNVFLTRGNLLNVMRQVSTNVFVACGMTFILIAGGIDLSIGAVMAMAGMVAAYLSLLNVPFVVCAFAAILVGALAGLINGVIVAKTDLQPFIVTYATQIILRGMVYVITGAGTWRLLSSTFLGFGGASLGTIPLPVLYMIVVVASMIILLNRTRFGRHIYAIGGNPKAAQYAGIDISRIKMIIYMLSGILAALAGLVMTSRNSSMQPGLANGAEMDAIAAVVLGGTSMAGGQGAIGGTVIGAFIIGFINNGLNLLGMNSFWQYIVKGIVILIAVYLDYIKSKRLSSVG